MHLRQLIDRETCTYTYILWDSNTLDALIIDPVLEQVSRDLEYINKLNLKLKYILETHVHADHITGASKIKDITKSKICYGSKTGVDGADILLGDNETFNVGSILIKALHTPGHTEGCTSYFIDGCIFTGDTLFIEGTGRTDFQGGSSVDTYNSVRNKIFSLPDETIIYPGHNYKGFTSSTIEYERKHNPNVGDSVDVEDYVLREKNMNRPYPKRFDVAVPANLLCGKENK